MPLPRIRVDQVTPKHEARDFVVKPDGVVAHANRAGLAEGLLDLRRKLVFGQALFQAQLRRDTRDEARLGVGQEIVGGLAIQHERLADLVQRRIRANGRKLRGPVAPGVDAEGLVVVPEKGVRRCTVISHE